MALDTYNAEGDALQKQLQTTAELESSDYARYLDRLNQYNRELALAQADADTAYARMIDDDERTYSRAVDDYERQLTADDLDYERKQDYYNRLVSLIGIGYAPTAQDYANAGLSPTQGAAIRQQYLNSIAPSSSGGGGGSGRTAKTTSTSTPATPTTKPTTTTPSKEQMKQEYLAELERQGYSKGSQLYQSVLRS